MTSTDPELTPALIVHPILAQGDGRDPALRLKEAEGLAEALDLDVAAAHAIVLRDMRPATLFGSGKVDGLAEEIKALGAEVAVIDAALTPVQQRNLEKAWNVKVLDRTGMILEIFGRRARTREGRLQVELARLSYEKSRLVRTWTHLERQRGGRGFLAGPGETQIEADRRIIGERISKLRKELSEVRRTRGLHRAQRKKAPFPLVALVGYTNAGKSTLFNLLTDSKVLAKDMLFATLDPTLRGVKLSSGVKAMFADTVGFISDLPTDLVEAFKATLEEVREADVLVHVRDVSHEETDAQKADVETILEQLGGAEDRERPLIEVWNKIDRLDSDDRDVLALVARRETRETGRAHVPVSAATGEGIPAFLDAVDAVISDGAAVYVVRLAASDGRAHAWLHEHGEVYAEAADDTGALTMDVRLSALAAGRFMRSFPEADAQPSEPRAAQ